MSAMSRNTEHVDLAVLGTTVRVVLDDPADRECVEGPWHLCLLTRAEGDIPPSRVVTLRSSKDATSRRAALTELTQRVTYAAIGEQAGRFLMLHAGALADLESGAAVVYVAPGGTGKTTISTRLGPGRGYITDETVAVSRSGDITTYSKPLSTRVSAGGKEEIAPGRLGLVPAAALPWIAGLLLLRRDPQHHGDVIVTPLDVLDAIALLSPEISALAALDDPLRTCRDIIERAGGVLQVTYRDAEQLEPLVGDILRRVRM